MAPFMSSWLELDTVTSHILYQHFNDFQICLPSSSLRSLFDYSGSLAQCLKVIFIELMTPVQNRGPLEHT